MIAKNSSKYDKTLINYSNKNLFNIDFNIEKTPKLFALKRDPKLETHINNNMRKSHIKNH